MTDRELMQQALDALEAWDARGRLRIIEALRKQLAQCDRCGKANPAEIHTCTPKKQESVAVDSDKVICPLCCHQFRAIPVNVQQLMLAAGLEPPFTSLPQREWVGLTDEEIRDAYGSVCGKEWCIGGMGNAEVFYDAIEAKLKEKNG